MRKEIKFELTKSEYSNLYKKLNFMLQKDVNTQSEDKYTIKSIYFDNIYNKLLHENIDGKIYREKFRIRMYNNDINAIFLEKKINHNGNIGKEREKISYQEVLQICEGQINKIALNTKLKKERYINLKTKLLKPIIIIEYDRIAFVNKSLNFRITLDSKLHKDTCINNFFKNTIRKENNYILEVKYIDIIPKTVVDCLNINTQRKSISKYKNMRLNRCYLN